MFWPVRCEDNPTTRCNKSFTHCDQHKTPFVSFMRVSGILWSPIKDYSDRCRGCWKALVPGREEWARGCGLASTVLNVPACIVERPWMEIAIDNCRGVDEVSGSLCLSWIEPRRRHVLCESYAVAYLPVYLVRFSLSLSVAILQKATNADQAISFVTFNIEGLWSVCNELDLSLIHISEPTRPP